jgi:hypothetical protein
MVGDGVNSSSFAMVTSVRHSFLDNAQSLDVYNIIFLRASHGCGEQGTVPWFLKGIENILWVPLLFLFVFVILVNT